MVSCTKPHQRRAALTLLTLWLLEQGSSTTLLGQALLANPQELNQSSTVPWQITQVVCDGLHAGHKPGSYWLKKHWASTMLLSELTHGQHPPLVCRLWTESLCLPEQSSCGDSWWGPAAALSSFAAAGFPTAAVPAHGEATVAARLIRASSQNRPARLGV